jgi:hypothetical protein
MAGVNAYLSRHSQSDERQIDWDRPDVTKIADELAGETVLQLIEVPPGGNPVLSYLDVVAPEGTDPQFIADSLRLFEHYVRADRLPAVWVTTRIGMRFGAMIGLHPLAVAEFRRLRAHVLLLLGITTQSKVRPIPPNVRAPLRIVCSYESGGKSFQLTSASAKRVAVIRPEFMPVRVRISDDMRADFETLVGELYPHLVASLTGLSNAQLGQLGGVQIVDGDRVIWQRAAAGDLPGQLLGVWLRADEPLPSFEGEPTAAILPRQAPRPGDDVIYALDLVHVQDMWLPLSEAGIPAYVHAKALRDGERWSFVIAEIEGVSPIVFDAKLANALSPPEVTEAYGASVGERARPDHATIQLELRRRP